jgi:CRISPR-associated protein Cmr3
MWLLIEPTDVWMFRDGKPFSAGDSHTAQSLFPPTAFAIQGMLRTLLMMRRGQDFGMDERRDLVVSLDGFKMHGPYLVRKDKYTAQWERVFPLPADVSLYNKRDFRVLSPSADCLDDTNSDCIDQFQILAVSLDDEELEQSYWVTESVFNTRYLGQAELSIAECIPEVDLFVREHRFGNALNYNQRAVRSDDGMLYAAGFVRLQSSAGVLVRLLDDSPLAEIFPNDGHVEYFRFGGEARGARIQRLSNAEVSSPTIPELAPNDPFKLIFTTPTYFEDGVNSKSDKLLALFAGCIGAAVKRPLVLGGWDLAARRPRSILRYVAPGSVYYCKGSTPPVGLLTDQPKDCYPLHDLGFGEFLIGNWSETSS